MSAWLPAKKTFKRRNGWLILLLSIMTVGCYAIYWLYRLHQELPRRQGIDIKGHWWLLLFVGMTISMLFLLAISGYGASWNSWQVANGLQQVLFISGLVTAIALNAWFGFSSERLSERVTQRLTDKPPALLKAGKKTLLYFGVTCEMLVLTLPAALQAGLLVLPGIPVEWLTLLGRFGTGCLLSWGIALHRDTLKVANNSD